MINPNVIKSLRVVALAEADAKSFEAWYRSICRWYSREFSTPLTLVEEMPEEQVLRHYFEDVFWSLKNGNDGQQEAFEQIVKDTLVEDHKPTTEEAEVAEAEDDDWYEQELARLSAKLDAQHTSFTKETVVSSRDGILIDNPNLSKDTNKFVEVDDDPVPDDEGT